MQTSENIARDILRLFIWFPFRLFIMAIPPNWGFFIFKLMGNLHFYISSQKRQKVVRNIETFLNIDKECALGITKKYYENHYLDRLHIFLYPKLTTKEKIEKYVYLENIESINRELKNGRGILIVQPHFGPVQITLLALGLFDYNPIQIGYPRGLGLSKIGRAVSFKNRLKYEAMLPPIFPANKYLGMVYRHLAKGGVVFTTGDGAGGGVALGEQKIFRFLKTELMFPLGPAKWAIKTGAAFIPTFIIPERYNRFRIVFENPVERIYGDTEKDRIYITEKFISIAESYIRKFPYCWHFWDEIQQIKQL